MTHILDLINRPPNSNKLRFTIALAKLLADEGARAADHTPTWKKRGDQAWLSTAAIVILELSNRLIVSPETKARLVVRALKEVRSQHAL